MNAGRADVSGAQFHDAKFVIDARGIGADVAVAKAARNHAGSQKLNLMAGGERFQVTLKSLQIDLSVGRHIGSVAIGEEKLAMMV